jgi:hypothetical protein
MVRCGNFTHVSSIFVGGDMEFSQEEDDLERAIIAMEKFMEGDGVILTGWVVIAEFINQDGDLVLAGYARSRMPYWRINGLLDAGPEALAYAEEWDIEE